MRAARKRAQAIAKGRGREHRVVIPLAFEVAACISARPLDQFRNDATQLANGLKELHDAIGSDGVVVSLANGMELAASTGKGPDSPAILAGQPVAASLEACKRLREMLGDDAALLAGLTGPMTLSSQFGVSGDVIGECLSALVKAFLEAGADLIVLFEDNDAAPDEAMQAVLKTADNIARFHQGCLLSFNGQGLPAPVRQPLENGSKEGLGFILCDAQVAANADIAVLKQWVQDARGE